MTIELSRSDVALIQEALTVWERDPNRSALVTGMLDCMLTSKTERDESVLKTRMEASTKRAEETMRDRRSRSILLQAKLLQADARRSEQEVDV